MHDAIDAWCICYFIFLFKLFASSQNICRNPVIRVIDAKFVTLSPVIADEIDSIIRFFSVCLWPLVERVFEKVSLMLHKMRAPFWISTEFVSSGKPRNPRLSRYLSTKARTQDLNEDCPFDPVTLLNWSKSKSATYSSALERLANLPGESFHFSKFT